MRLSAQEFYDQLTSIKVEEMTFENIVFFEDGECFARIDFILNALEEYSFFLDMNRKLYCVDYYYDNSIHSVVRVYDDEQLFLQFNPIWQEYQKHHHLRLRLLFKRGDN